ncbi:gamma carbonic anhydrase family protein [Paraburkholderia sacchari]|uniref:gamma carbonic anhydrase family protein n=1 Tax=Paraburkholderia sacchari TaxID=159450 RepID=UPI0039A6D35C
MPIYKLADVSPNMHASAFVAETSVVIGDVTVGENANIWFGAVVRGDEDKIKIGANSNIQDNAVLHSDHGFPIEIGSAVTVGHQAMLHGCTIEERTLIGMRAVVMNGAVIGRHCIIGAGAVVTEGKKFPEGSLILGSPAKVVRQLTEAEINSLAPGAKYYVDQAQLFKSKLVRIG